MARPRNKTPNPKDMKFIILIFSMNFTKSILSLLIHEQLSCIYHFSILFLIITYISINLLISCLSIEKFVQQRLITLVSSPKQTSPTFSVKDEFSIPFKTKRLHVYVTTVILFRNM